MLRRTFSVPHLTFTQTRTSLCTRFPILYVCPLITFLFLDVDQFAHSLHNLGFAQLPGFQPGLDACYNNAKGNNLWGNTDVGQYAMKNTSNLSSSILILCSLRSILLAGEYFAEGMQAYFDVGRKTDKEAPYTRDMLKRQDPQLYTLIDQWMGHNEWIGSCPPS